MSTMTLTNVTVVVIIIVITAPVVILITPRRQKDPKQRNRNFKVEDQQQPNEDIPTTGEDILKPNPHSAADGAPLLLSN